MLNTTLVLETLAELGISFEDLAHACEVNVERVYRWLDHDEIPRPKKIRMLAEALGLEIEELFTDESTPVISWR